MRTVRGRAAVMRRVRRLVLAAVAVGALTWASRHGATMVIEVALLLGVLSGIAVTLRGVAGGRPRRGTALTDGSPDPGVAAAAADVLDRLDGIEHRRVDLGHPWPAVVVGPTGVHLVGVCPCSDGHGSAAAAAPGPAADERCPSCARTLRLAERVRQVVVDLDGARPVPVCTVVVVAEAGPAGTRGSFEVVSPAGLRAALARGPVLPMKTVDQVFGALAALATVGFGPHR